jgi:mono/diheme cytochrome c family protein
MLRGIDKGLAWASWTIAAVLLVMLFAGPGIFAEDKGTKAAASGSSPYAKGGTTKAAAPDGAALFKDNCGSCHTLSSAGTSGAVGPKLDGLALAPAIVSATMASGPGVMPSFTGQLSPPQLDALAAYVSKASQ